jgi:UDP-N-acetylmuramoyl-L-alanyl-D-glutamate--2,6-diaminopimelate ligase
VTWFPLKRIVAALDDSGVFVAARGALPDTVHAITDDTRHLAQGDLFIAVRGVEADGHRFLAAASAQGATAAIVEDPGSTSLPHILVRDSRVAAAVAAAAFNRFPARELRIAGVTGTNGKTTVVNVVRHIMHRADRPAASIGTLGVAIGGDSAHESVPARTFAAMLTTPGSIELQSCLRELVNQGVRTVAMEVSSHSLDQRRVECVEFATGVFTNLTRDHIDYHRSMEAYFEAKARLVDHLAPNGILVLNADDQAWQRLPLQGHRVVRFSAGGAAGADVRASGVSYTATGSQWTLEIESERHHVRLGLTGAFNVSNAVAAAATAWAMGETPAAIARMLNTAPQVTGRMERLLDSPVVLRDYAHTPDALERALQAVRQFAPVGVTVVFGCGGDRDRGKRPQMGGIAARLADHVIVTSDNPRTEDPERILDDIVAGMPAGTRYERIEDRRAAIASALEHASRTGDVVLLAGKGHETYQVRGTSRVQFDEREVVSQLVREAALESAGGHK